VSCESWRVVVGPGEYARPMARASTDRSARHTEASVFMPSPKRGSIVTNPGRVPALGPDRWHPCRRGRDHRTEPRRRRGERPASELLCTVGSHRNQLLSATLRPSDCQRTAGSSSGQCCPARGEHQSNTDYWTDQCSRSEMPDRLGLIRGLGREVSAALLVLPGSSQQNLTRSHWLNAADVMPIRSWSW